MRDFLLNESLRRLATEAATRFNAMVAEGEQIPFDVATDTAEDSPFYSYVPQTGRFADLKVDETVVFGFDPLRAVCFRAASHGR